MTNGNPARSGIEKKKGKRGSVRNASRLETLNQRRSTALVDWLGCDPEKLQDVVHKITALGGAVTFGTSRDGGSASLTLFLDDGKTTLWFNGDADLSDELASVAEFLKQVS